MPTVLVRDRSDRVVANVKVFIKWKDGTSTVYSDGSGSADIISNGYVEYVEVKGEKIPVKAQLSGSDAYVVKLKT